MQPGLCLGDLIGKAVTKMKRAPLYLLSIMAFLSCSNVVNPAGPSTVFENEILRQVNEIRTKGCNCGKDYMPPVKPVRWNKRLAEAAQTQADYMNRVDRMTHTGNSGSTVSERINATGYRWGFCAENIAAGQLTEKEVMSSWLKSPGHCKNIMSRNATEMGAGKSGAYWSQVFARQR